MPCNVNSSFAQLPFELFALRYLWYADRWLKLQKIIAPCGQFYSWQSFLFIQDSLKFITKSKTNGGFYSEKEVAKSCPVNSQQIGNTIIEVTGLCPLHFKSPSQSDRALQFLFLKQMFDEMCGLLNHLVWSNGVCLVMLEEFSKKSNGKVFFWLFSKMSISMNFLVHLHVTELPAKSPKHC